MRKIISVWLILVISVIFANTCWAKAESKRVKEATRILSVIMSSPDGKAPRYLLSHARAILLIPGVKKIGLLVGIKRGKGVIVAKDKNGKWLPPSFITLSGGSLGFQAGAKSSDIVLLIMTDNALKKFLGNRLKVGVDLGIAAGPVGKEIGISQQDLNKIEAFSYVRERGIFAGAILSGSVLSHDEKSNQKFYGTKITFNDILSGKQITLPPEAKELLETLEKFSH